MSSCLGLYIEPNIIKYAKVSKEHENLKVEAFGIKFYDKIGEAIKQIINDTYSFKVPISINLSEEIYQYFYMFNLLNKNDLKKAIETEFEALCLEKNINPNALEHRYALVNSQEEKDKIKVIHISANKNVINTIEQPFAEYRVSTLSSIGTSISNVANIKQKENVVIANMEEQTTFTTIIDQKIYQVDKIEEGAKKVLDSINIKENSYSKAYEICKNSTIYTMEGKELQEETNEYLDDIMPTLYKIASSLQEKLQESTIKIDKIYLTGTLSVINNVDLYFQEFFKNEKCEILKPFFVKETVKINIKDYVQVNSAIGLALQGLDYGIKDMNFKKKTLKDSIDSLTSKLNIEIGEGKGKTKINFDKNINLSLKGKLDRTEAWMLRTLTGVLLLIGIYSAFAVFLNYSITNKNKEVEEVKKDTQTQIASVEKDIQTIKSKTNNYEQMSNNLKNINEQAAEKSKNKKVIPNLLSEIQFAIPQGVQITSIENTSGRHIVINAQSTKYEQLGYFKAVLRLQGILEPDTIVSSPGEKQNDLVKVVIEGDLP